jgi:hypothetical protein
MTIEAQDLDQPIAAVASWLAGKVLQTYAGQVGWILLPPLPPVEYEPPNVLAFIESVKQELAAYAERRGYVNTWNGIASSQPNQYLPLRVKVDDNGDATAPLHDAALKAGFKVGFGIGTPDDPYMFAVALDPMEIQIDPFQVTASYLVRCADGHLHKVRETIWRKQGTPRSNCQVT